MEKSKIGSWKVIAGIGVLILVAVIFFVLQRGNTTVTLTNAIDDLLSEFNQIGGQEFDSIDEGIKSDIDAFDSDIDGALNDVSNAGL